MEIIQKAVIKREERYLILKRALTAKHFAGCWDFPGGKLEKDEDPKTGIERKVLEETGLTGTATNVLQSIQLDVYNVGHKTHQFDIFAFEPNSIDEIVLSSEHTAWQWATKEQILNLDGEPYFEFVFAKDGV